MKNNNFNFIDVLPYFKGRNNLFFKKIYTLQKKGHEVLSEALINYLTSD